MKKMADFSVKKKTVFRSPCKWWPLLISDPPSMQFSSSEILSFRLLPSDSYFNIKIIRKNWETRTPRRSISDRIDESFQIICPFHDKRWPLPLVQALESSHTVYCLERLTLLLFSHDKKEERRREIRMEWQTDCAIFLQIRREPYAVECNFSGYGNLWPHLHSLFLILETEFPSILKKEMWCWLDIQYSLTRFES